MATRCHKTNVLALFGIQTKGRLLRNGAMNFRCYTAF